jgi:hypothetical protein
MFIPIAKSITLGKPQIVYGWIGDTKRLKQGNWICQARRFSRRGQLAKVETQ